METIYKKKKKIPCLLKKNLSKVYLISQHLITLMFEFKKHLE